MKRIPSLTAAASIEDIVIILNSGVVLEGAQSDDPKHHMAGQFCFDRAVEGANVNLSVLGDLDNIDVHAFQAQIDQLTRAGAEIDAEAASAIAVQFHLGAIQSAGGSLIDGAVPELGDVTAAMREHDQERAPGSESVQWQMYLRDADQHGCDALSGPYDESTMPLEFSTYWLAIAARDYDRARRFGDVPSEWEDEPVVLN